MNSNERLHDLDVKCSALLLFNKVRGKINKTLVKVLSFCVEKVTNVLLRKEGGKV